MTEIRRFLTELRKDKRGLMAGVLVAVTVALVGWGAAFGSMVGSGDLEGQLLATAADLSKTKMELSKMSDELAAAQENIRKRQEATASLEDVAGQLEAGRSELASLELRINTSEAQLDALGAEAGRLRDKTDLARRLLQAALLGADDVGGGQDEAADTPARGLVETVQ